MAQAGQLRSDHALFGRRSSHRFSFVADLQYKLLHPSKPVKTGRGQTVNVSGKGVLFESDETLPVGRLIELAIPWPVKLSVKVGLTLCASGPIVRVQGNCVAVQITQYEFRTKYLEPSRLSIGRAQAGAAS